MSDIVKIKSGKSVIFTYLIYVKLWNTEKNIFDKL
jgi:hypothetical protein